MRACPLRSTCARPQPLPTEMLSRREWVKRFAIGSAVAAGWRSTLLADISPGANPANIITLDLASFPVLQGEYGSIQLNLFHNLGEPPPPNSVITITRAPGNIFHAVSAYCTHSGCITDKYEAGDTNAIICYCHNSVYNIQGHVLSEATPGQANLPYYNSSLAGNTLRIEIPNLNMKVNSIAVQSTTGGTKRLALAFPAKRGGRYRVRYTPDLVTAPTTEPFFTTLAGTISQNEITQTSNSTRTLYVDSTATRGFYFVELVLASYP